jgi:hypothetical protein
LAAFFAISLRLSGERGRAGNAAFGPLGCFARIVLHLPRRDPRDHDGSADHVGQSLLAFGALGHQSPSPLNTLFTNSVALALLPSMSSPMTLLTAAFATSLSLSLANRAQTHEEGAHRRPITFVELTHVGPAVASR